EWTGRCGTVFGWHIHQTEGIPPCQPCIDARDSGSVVFSGALFRQLREGKALSRERLARQIGVNAATIQYWETGRSLPTRQNKLDLALRAMDAMLEEVCEEDGQALWPESSARSSTSPPSGRPRTRRTSRSRTTSTTPVRTRAASAAGVSPPAGRSPRTRTGREADARGLPGLPRG